MEKAADLANLEKYHMSRVFELLKREYGELPCFDDPDAKKRIRNALQYQKEKDPQVSCCFG